MAFWVVNRRGCSPDDIASDGYISSNQGKRRNSQGPFDHEMIDHGSFFSKKARLEEGGRFALCDSNHGYFTDQPQSLSHHDSRNAFGDGRSPRSHSSDVQPVSFFIIKEHNPDCTQPHGAGSPGHSHTLSHAHLHPHLHLHHHHPDDHHRMERTESGLSISSTDSSNTPPSPESPTFLTDAAATSLVRGHISRLHRRTPNRHSRILNTLITPRKHRSSPAFTLDDSALESIFSAANDLFFANKLRGRVTWDWSHPSSRDAAKYTHAIVGTTALRKVRSRRGGYETLIVLSSPILRDTKYNRRLLISTFLHEMIHSFLFVVCGRKAGVDGGHTKGFRDIAGMIDEWVGGDYLRLSEMEADLDRFTEDHSTEPQQQQQHHYFHHHNDHYRHQDHDDPQSHHPPPWQGRDDTKTTTPSMMRPSSPPRFPSADAGDEPYRSYDGFPGAQYTSAHPRYNEPSEEWLWQRREGFGDPHEGRYH